MWTVAVAAGLLMGVTLGALGAGGAIITVPVLVYALGQDPHEATTSSLVIVGLTAAVGAVGHFRAGRVDWRRGLIFGVIGIAGTAAGSRLAAGVDGSWLLLAFAGLLLVVAALMWRRSAAEPAPGTEARPPSWARIVPAALGVGLLTGFFGVGGGFAVVPALVLAAGFEMPMAVGTSLLVIALNSASALVGRVAAGISVDWKVIAVFTLAAMAGSLVGPRLVSQVSPRTLTRAFASVLAAVAVYMMVRA